MSEAKFEIKWLVLHRAVNNYLAARDDYFKCLKTNPKNGWSFVQEMWANRKTAAAAAMWLASEITKGNAPEPFAAYAENLWDRFNTVLRRVDLGRTTWGKENKPELNQRINEAVASVREYLEEIQADNGPEKKHSQ